MSFPKTIDNANLRETHSRAIKKFPAIYKLFNCRWHPTETRNKFLSVFSVTEWKRLSQEEKQQHSLQNCKACTTQHQTLTSAFPCKRVTKKKPAIHFSESELSSPKKFGCKALRELNGITREKFGLTVQQVFSETPKSQLCRKPTSNERKTEKRQWKSEMTYRNTWMNMVLRQ